MILGNYIIRQVKVTDAEALLEFFKKVGSETNFLTMDEKGLGLTVQDAKGRALQF